MPWTNTFSSTVAAAVAFIGIDNDLAVFKSHSTLLADLDTVTYAAAAALALTALGTCVN